MAKPQVQPRGGPSAKPLANRQRGAAILTAMLTVTLVASLAAAALWQQWRGLEVETAQRSRVQSAWMLVGALDWARLILREDARSGGVDHLGEPWAVPLEEARLATFFSAETSANDKEEDVAQSFISGRILDMQARLNVMNLVESGKVSLPAVRQFAKLFDMLGLPERELAVLTENLRFALDSSTDNRSGARASLVPQRVEQLVWLGLSARSVAMMSPYVTVLPLRTTVNLNTASAEVIYASIGQLDMAGARRMVNTRSLAHFQTLNDAGKLLGDLSAQIGDGQHGVASRFFEVRGRLRLGQSAVLERSLVQRDGLDVKTLWRERVAGVPKAMDSLQ